MNELSDDALFPSDVFPVDQSYVSNREYGRALSLILSARSVQQYSSTRDPSDRASRSIVDLALNGSGGELVQTEFNGEFDQIFALRAPTAHGEEYDDSAEIENIQYRDGNMVQWMENEYARRSLQAVAVLDVTHPIHPDDTREDLQLFAPWCSLHATSQPHVHAHEGEGEGEGVGPAADFDDFLIPHTSAGAAAAAAAAPSTNQHSFAHWLQSCSESTRSALCPSAVPAGHTLLSSFLSFMIHRSAAAVPLIGLILPVKLVSAEKFSRITRNVRMDYLMKEKGMSTGPFAMILMSGRREQANPDADKDKDKDMDTTQNKNNNNNNNAATVTVTAVAAVAGAGDASAHVAARLGTETKKRRRDAAETDSTSEEK